ncbi:MAG: general secretion pathway protein GspB [Pseudomonadota bacterium]
MSSILEALKKSEAQRAAGNASRAPLATEPQHRSSQNRRLLLMMPLAIGLAVTVAWRYGLLTSPDDVDSIETPTVAGTAPAAGEAVPAVAPAPAQPAPARAIQPTTAAESAGAAPKPVTEAQPLGPTTEAPAPASSPELGDATVQTETPAAPVATAGSSPPLAEPTDVPMPATATAEPPAQPADDTADAPPPKPGSRLPSLAQLPALEQEIGAVEMTMLVYSQDPARRFALVNGQRLKEGETLEGGVELLEIRRDSCVFAARGQRFVIRSQ